MLCANCRSMLLPEHRRAVRLGLFALILGGAAILMAALLLLMSGGAVHTNVSLVVAVICISLFGAVGCLVGGSYVNQTLQMVTARESPESKALMGRFDLISMIVLAVCGLACIPLGYKLFFDGNRARGAAEKAFSGQLDKFNKLLEDDGAELANPKPALKGRVLVLDQQAGQMPGIRSGQISDVQFELPRGMRAGKPSDVATVVWLRWKREEQTPGYRNSKAYRVSCEVVLVDPKQPAILDRKGFVGGPPPSAVVSGQDGYGSLPTANIVKYLLSLPRQ